MFTNGGENPFTDHLDQPAPPRVPPQRLGPPRPSHEAADLHDLNPLPSSICYPFGSRRGEEPERCSSSCRSRNCGDLVGIRPRLFLFLTEAESSYANEANNSEDVKPMLSESTPTRR
ncbi:hypothetical protein EJB05_09829, partial [Eragrostis curvula]